MGKLTKQITSMVVGSSCVACLAMTATVAMPTNANAWHYTPGSLGICGAVIPPPGFHYINYNVFYNADTFKDSDGNSADIGFDLGVYANVSQFVYMTDVKILGADFGIDAVVPLVSTDLKISATGVDSNEFGLGDITLEPIALAWHGARYDAIAGLAAIIPAGDTDEPASAGKGYWSIMETLGLNVYLDQERTWSASMLTRWIENFEDPDTKVTSGMELVAEYGIGKTLVLQDGLFFRSGIAGYSAVQLTDDDGPGTDSDERRQINAVGPDINFTLLSKIPLQLEARYMFEYGGESTAQGQLATITLRASF
jgi:hypothetical protein